MNTTFSVLQRDKTIQDITAQELDLLVIGGGITGAGIALDAQVRGIRTAVIEMQDFASGTSNRSTKLVHGGLRYLKQFEVGLVAEVGKERAIVYENGPHVTTPVWMLLPIIQGGTYGKMASSIGIYVYDILAGVKHSERRQMLGLDATLKKEPLLRKEGLKGSGYYVEYRTDDARLTLEILKEAVERGTLAVNYMKAVDLIYRQGRLCGVKVNDLLSGETHEIYAKKIVNATGPWVDELRTKDGSKEGKSLHHTKGVHIVVDGERFPLQNSVYFDVPDGRMIFAIPRDGKTYIGTTDTDYHGDLTFPRMTARDRDYLIDCVNFMFPSVRLQADDVESSWVGIRPLVHEEGKGPSEISRKDEVFHSATGLITIAGGKLTGYRKMADKVTSIVATELARESGKQFPACTTDKIQISGGKFDGSKNFQSYVSAKIDEGVQLGLTFAEAKKLVHRYGTNCEEVFDLIRQRGNEAAAHGLSEEMFASLLYSIHSEMTVTPSDFFIRRTASLYFDIEWVRRWQEPVINFMANLYGWSESQINRHHRDLQQRIREAVETVENDDSANTDAATADRELSESVFV